MRTAWLQFKGNGLETGPPQLSLHGARFWGQLPRKGLLRASWPLLGLQSPLFSPSSYVVTKDRQSLSPQKKILKHGPGTQPPPHTPLTELAIPRCCLSTYYA